MEQKKKGGVLKKVLIVFGILVVIGAVGSFIPDDKAEETAETNQSTPAEDEGVQNDADNDLPKETEKEPEQDPIETTADKKDNEIKEDVETKEDVEEETSSSFEGGMYKVGEDLPAGEYLIESEDSFLPGYLEVTKDSSGSLDSIVTNDSYTNRVYITVKKGQYLKFDGAAIPVEDAAPYQAEGGVYSDGMYIVGKDIPAGEYKIKVTDTVTGFGYFEVAKDSSGSLNAILTNDMIDSDAYQTIKKGQYIKLSGVEISTK